MRHFYDVVFEESGYYNLGWQPKESEEDFTWGQQSLVSLVTEPLRRFSGGGLILEVGCGQGAPAEQTADDLGVRVVGLELLAEQLKFCRTRRNDSLKFVQGDACVLPFADNSFDGAYSLESAFHYPDKIAFIKECARVLKPRGLLLLADIMRYDGRPSLLSLRNISRAAGAQGFFSEQDYEEIALEAGLKVVRSVDLTEGVARSMRKLAGQTLRNWKQLRRHFSMGILAAAVIASWSHPLTRGFLPVEYRWMVMEKSEPLS